MKKLLLILMLAPMVGVAQKSKLLGVWKTDSIVSVVFAPDKVEDNVVSRRKIDLEYCLIFTDDYQVMFLLPPSGKPMDPIVNRITYRIDSYSLNGYSSKYDILPNGQLYIYYEEEKGGNMEVTKLFYSKIK